ncbi:MAG: short-chain fatty acyl-CoA regulator family protein [Pseudomonadota bacterium]
MAQTKIFAGPRLRRIRGGLELTQTAMAERLEISPSYLNLLERNQRPLTVQLLMKLSSTFGVDITELQMASDSTTMAELKEVFSDPLLEGELPGDTELLELVDGAPNAAAAVVKLFRAYREQQDRMSDLGRLLGQDGPRAATTPTRLPLDEVRNRLENQPTYFPSIETAAAQILSECDEREGIYEGFKHLLRTKHGIAVQYLPYDTMPLWRRRFDRHSNRLFLSERISMAERFEAVATEVALIEAHKLLAEEVGFLKLTGHEPQRLAHQELARSLALALMMPYDTYMRRGLRNRFDLEALAGQFSVSFAHAAYRLTMMQRKGQSAPNVFVMEVDHTGQCIRRSGSRGFPFARFGGECGRLPVFRAFGRPGDLIVERVVTPDEVLLLVLSQTVEGPRSAAGEERGRRALLVGFEAHPGGGLVYDEEYEEFGGRGGVVPIGPSCRLCERQACLARAHPPLTRPLALDEHVTGISDFDWS